MSTVSLFMAKICYNKLIDPIINIIALMESLLSGGFGSTSGDQRECYKRIHACSWGLHTLVMDIITAVGIEKAATRTQILERYRALFDPTQATLENLLIGFDGALEAEQHTAVEHAAACLRRIERMVGNLWQYSLLQNGMLPYSKKEFDGRNLLHRLSMKSRAMKLPPGMQRFTVLGDTAQLLNAFGEIGHNIDQHSQAQLASVKVDDFGYRVDIAILDRGRGFRAGAGDPFEAFWQSDEENIGLGLGLYLASRHVESCGGRMLLKSIPGRGTMLKVSLPTLP